MSLRPEHRPDYLDWKTSRLVELRDSNLAWIAEANRKGIDVYPVDLVVRMLERELDRRTLETPDGSLQVIADVEDLEATA